jgi:hypothetical protein
VLPVAEVDRDRVEETGFGAALGLLVLGGDHPLGSRRSESGPLGVSGAPPGRE